MPSPPVGPLPGVIEASVAGPSFRQRVRGGVAVLGHRYGLRRLFIASLLLGALLAGASWQLGTSVRIVLKAQLAQMLIAHAWDKNLAAGRALAKPWQWADMRPLARLSLPRQQTELFVLDDDSGRTLAFGPGHHPGTAIPGRGGNAVISGHRDTHFSVLKDVNVGDSILLETLEGRKLIYQVSQLQIVDKHDTWVAADHGRDELTLVTCWPFDTLTPRGPQRLIVSAERQG